MRIGFVAALLLSPLMVHAQANKPNGLMLSAASSADRTTSTARVSTGVEPPKLIHVVPIQQSTVPAYALPAKTRHAVVMLMVDEKGVPSDVKIVESPGVWMDQNLVDAVNQCRFKPGTVSGQVTAVPVRLELTIQDSGE
jgi:TonB family protein